MILYTSMCPSHPFCHRKADTPRESIEIVWMRMNRSKERGRVAGSTLAGGDGRVGEEAVALDVRALEGDGGLGEQAAVDAGAGLEVDRGLAENNSVPGRGGAESDGTADNPDYSRRV